MKMKKLYHGGKILTMEDRMPAEAVREFDS